MHAMADTKIGPDDGPGAKDSGSKDADERPQVLEWDMSRDTLVALFDRGKCVFLRAYLF